MNAEIANAIEMCNAFQLSRSIRCSACKMGHGFVD